MKHSRFFCVTKKKGVSAIIAVVMTILITVAGVAIIWGLIIPTIQDGSLSEELISARLSVQTSGGYTLYDENADVAIVQVKRGADEVQMVGVEIIFSIDGDSEKTIANAPAPNNMKVYEFNFTGKGIPDSISVAPIFLVNGVEKIGVVTSKVDIKNAKIINVPTTGLLMVGGDSRSVVEPQGDCSVAGDCTLGVCQENPQCAGGVCAYDDITACSHGDSCCPAGCDIGNDNDCSATCSDGVKNQDEVEADCGGVCIFGVAEDCSVVGDEDNDCLVDCADSDCSEDAACVGECVVDAVASCGSEVGSCEFGEKTCLADETWGGCVGEVGPSIEFCEGSDNDCNGVDDNDCIMAEYVWQWNTRTKSSWNSDKAYITGYEFVPYSDESVVKFCKFLMDVTNVTLYDSSYNVLAKKYMDNSPAQWTCVGLDSPVEVIGGNTYYVVLELPPVLYGGSDGYYQDGLGYPFVYNGVTVTGSVYQVGSFDSSHGTVLSRMNGLVDIGIAE